MGFSQRSRDAMNEQLMREIQASYTYLSMAEYCQSIALEGFAKWLDEQSQEEWGHAMKFRRFIQDRGERVRFDAVPAPAADFTSVADVFERALEHEQAVSQAINNLYALAEEEKDFASQAFLDWFVNEQVEEERTIGGILDWVRRLGDSPQGLFLLDRQLGGGDLEGATGEASASSDA
ncbi:MAG: ferritin [Actinomycetota bacterium]|nr:ferritin [Actinomycetota bacterium]